MALSLFGRDDLQPHVAGETPLAGKVISAILSMVTVVVLTFCLTRRINATSNWHKVPLTRWLTFAIYADSVVFIIAATILDHGFGLNSNQLVCSASILICLTCYLTTKALIFYFLIEKVYIIQSVRKSRLKSKLYLFNVLVMLLPYCAIIVLNFIYRVAYFDKTGTCIIGMEVKSVMPLIIMDALINFYLTLLFVVPLRRLYSYKSSPNNALRTIALRSFIGSCGTLTSSVVNLTVLMVLHGEAAWICLMCCNADIIFSVVVLHWVTSKDSSNTVSTRSHSTNNNQNPATHLSTLPKSSNFQISSMSSGNHNRFNPSVDHPAGTVTTDISAANNKGTDTYTTGDFDDGKIRIQVERVVEREGSQASSTEVGEDISRRDHSTEDLVYRS